MLRDKRFSLVVALLVLALSGSTVVNGAEKVLNVGVIRDPVSSSYATPGVEPYITGVYEVLVFVSPDMDLEPGLAVSWERINELTWRFHLRQGVTYHNGKPFNASTVKFSIDWVLEKILWSWLLNLDRAEIVDEYTIDLITSAPTGVLPGLMSYGWAVMSEPESQAAGEPVGTGPFKYESSIPGERLVVVKNEDYWQSGIPIIDRIVFKVIVDDSSRVMALMSGEVDLAIQIPYPAVAQIEAAGYRTFKTVTSQWSHLLFSVRESPVDDLRVRKAIGYGIDREAIIDNVLYGLGIASNSPILPDTPWSGEASLEGLPYNPQKAEALLEEAGWVKTPTGVREKNGKPLSIVLRVDNQPSKLLAGREMAQVMAEQLGRLGFDVEVSIEDVNILYDESAANYKGHIYLDYHGTFSGDQTSALWSVFQPNREVYMDTAAVYGEFIPPIAGEWLFALQNATTDEEREKYLVKLSNLINRDMVLSLPFLNNYMVVGAAQNVTGYLSHPLYFWPAVWNTVDIE